MAVDKRTERHIDGIDGLRAIAVLAVILFHIRDSLLPGGFIGVDVFFVISGYVVSGSLSRSKVDSFRRFTTGFYARRILRIYPALIIFLLGAVTMRTLLIPGSWLSDADQQVGISAFFGFSNFALISSNDGYFSPRVEYNIFTHTWSLAVEEQFYLIFPFLLFLWLRRGMKGDLKSLTLGSPVFWLAIASLVIAAFQSTMKPDWAYYLLPSRFWEMAAGGILYQLNHSGHGIPKSARSAGLVSTLGLLLIGLGAWFSRSDHFPFPDGLLPVAGTVLAIAATVSGQRTTAERVLTHPVAVYIGKISYSLYLWHWAVLVLMRWTVGIENALEMLAAFALTVAAAMTSYHIVEQPTRKLAMAYRPPARLVLPVGLAITLIAVGLTVGAYRYNQYISLSVTRDTLTWQSIDWSPTPQLPATSGPFKDRHLFIFGDSHAGAYGRLAVLLRNDGIGVTISSKAGCALTTLLDTAGKSCDTVYQEKLRLLAEEGRPGDVILLSARRAPTLAQQFQLFNKEEVLKTLSSPEERERQREAFEQADAFITKLEALGFIVALDGETPLLGAPQFRCSDWFNRQNPICRNGTSLDTALLEQLNEPARSGMKRLSERHHELIIWDIFHQICPGQSCEGMRDGKPLFFDSDHLSGYSNEILYPSMKALLLHQWQDSA